MLGFFPLSYIATLAGFTLTMHTWLPTDTQRKWVLSTAVNTIVSAAGLYQFAYWWITRDVSDGGGVRALMDLLQAYMVVDLVHNGWYYGNEMNLLEFWVHHSVYIVLFGGIRVAGLSGLMRPFFILELPSAVRAWGTMVPAWRSDAWFGATFAALRVALPFYNMIALREHMPLWLWPFIVAMQAMHCYWFYRWTHGQIRRMRASLQESCPIVG